MKKTPYYSYKLGNLSKGCKLCVKGSKLVLFTTGLCPRCCYYCPISDSKYKKDVIYADEWKVKSLKDIIQEAKLISAQGAGITGGDPLCKLDRTIRYIKTLKKTFGKKFHIHLYTSPDSINKTNLGKLDDAGLDEIRFHLDLEDNKLWQRIKLALEYSWDVGVEIPAIPKKEGKLKKIIDFLEYVNNKSKNKVKFLNLNELEAADNKVNKLVESGYKTKNDLSYAVKGSEELALRLLNYIERNKIRLNAHYCTAKLKARVQLGNRIKRRARNVKKSYDQVTVDGTLIRGAVYLSELKPGFSYREKLRKADKVAYIKKLKSIRNSIKKDFGIETIEVDTVKLRILTSVKDVYDIRDKIDNNFLKNIVKDKKLLKIKELYLAVVEEYPTQDQMELSVEFI